MNTINYLNIFFEEITNNQALQSSEYILEKRYNSSVKVQEHYIDNFLSSVTYFLDNTENQNLILQEYSNIQIKFYKNEIISGVYRKYDVEIFDPSGLITNKYIEVYGESIYPIYYKAIDIQTNDIIHLQKSFYDSENELSYEFEYDELTGDFSKLTILDPNNYVDTDDRTIFPSEVGIGNNPYNFTWMGFEYYQNALPIIPV